MYAHRFKTYRRPNISLPTSPLRLGPIPTLELELLRRRLRLSFGSAGLRPLARAYRFRISVSETTPTRRPERRAPGSEEAGIEVEIGDGMDDDAAGDEEAGW